MARAEDFFEASFNRRIVASDLTFERLEELSGSNRVARGVSRFTFLEEVVHFPKSTDASDCGVDKLLARVPAGDRNGTPQKTMKLRLKVFER